MGSSTGLCALKGLISVGSTAGVWSLENCGIHFRAVCLLSTRVCRNLPCVVGLHPELPVLVILVI